MQNLELVVFFGGYNKQSVTAAQLDNVIFLYTDIINVHLF